MKFPNFNEEKKLWKKGYKFVAGLDEAGRGPLAGPVVAVAVIIRSYNKKHSDIMQNVRMFLGVRDSKKLSEKQREYFYKILTNHPQIKWGIGIVSEKVIDKINILEATKLAMRKSLDSLNFSFKLKKATLQNYSSFPRKAGIVFFLIDGNFKLGGCRTSSQLNQKSIIKGDQKVFSIAAASIIAKVTRDRIMRKMHKKYPKYGFDRHKGYGTVLHIKNLRDFGPCPIHRITFAKVLPKSNLSDRVESI